MSWLVLLIIFWKPIYNLIMWAFKRDTTYKTALVDWVDHLWALIAPGS